MIVQVNHVPRLKYGQWLDIRQAGQVGWGKGINNRTLGVDCHFKLEGVGCFYELRSKTWANRLIGDRMRTRVVFHLNAKSDPIGNGSVAALTKVASNATIALMSRALEEVAREAIELSQEERLVLARILLEGCDLPGYPINEAEQTWEEEIADRIRAIDSGTVKARSWEDVLGDVDRRLAG
jgi:hypothetical protein